MLRCLLNFFSLKYKVIKVSNSKVRQWEIKDRVGKALILKKMDQTRKQEFNNIPLTSRDKISSKKAEEHVFLRNDLNTSKI